MDDRDRIAMIDRETGRDTVIRYQLADHLGSSSIELDDKANIISYEEYHPFGTTSYQKHNTNISQKRYKYTGKERDNETGMYYYGARYYAAWICRFVSVDPLAGEYKFQNPYAYAANSPIKFIDDMGMEPKDIPENDLEEKYIDKRYFEYHLTSKYPEVNEYVKYELVDDEKNTHKTTYTRHKSEVYEKKEGTHISRIVVSSTEVITTLIDGKGEKISCERSYAKQITEITISGGYGSAYTNSKTKVILEKNNDAYDLNSNRLAREFANRVSIMIKSNPEWNPWNQDVSPREIGYVAAVDVIINLFSDGKKSIRSVIGKKNQKRFWAISLGIFLGNEFRKIKDHSGSSITYKVNTKNGEFTKL